MKKKMIATVLSTMLVMGLTACGNTANETTAVSEGAAANVETESTEPEITVTESTVTESTETAGDETANDETEVAATVETEEAADTVEGGKTLVVYYSATGNTENVANIIAEITNADLFEIEPSEAYTSEDLDWNNNASRVSVEHDNPDSREVELLSTAVDGWDTYDTVYIGYPIWWGIAAWPMDTFVKANDFTGKTVIPFCTASSSGIGDSGELLEEMTGTGTWLEGDRFHGSSTEEEITTWIDSLGI